jgi:hypothetical protein
MKMTNIPIIHLLSENAGLASLRISEIHGLIKQLVYNHKVVSDTLFFNLTEVIFEDL